MGSKSDWPIMKNASVILNELKISYEVKIISAHRTPMRLYEYALKVLDRNLKVIIAGAGGAAHLPGMTASITTLPVIGVPIRSTFSDGLDSLLSIAQMPSGVPVATMAVGDAGATNAGLYAASIISNYDDKIASNLKKWRSKNTKSVPNYPF